MLFMFKSRVLAVSSSTRHHNLHDRQEMSCEHLVLSSSALRDKADLAAFLGWMPSTQHRGSLEPDAAGHYLPRVLPNSTSRFPPLVLDVSDVSA